MPTMSHDRLLVIAPHPDDEAIGAGALIQRIVAQGGQVRVLFLTDGERNSWPQRYEMKKWTINDADRRSWAEKRRREALASMKVLGLPPESAVFLGFPDQKLAHLARAGDERLTERIRAELRELTPSLLVVSSAQDLHSDHRAAAWFSHHAVRGLGDLAPEIVTYVVHGEGDAGRIHAALALTSEERARKREAISQHQSQLLLSRARFLAYARETETYFKPEFDLVCLESRVRERMGAVRHSCRVLLGRSRPVSD